MFFLSAIDVHRNMNCIKRRERYYENKVTSSLASTQGQDTQYTTEKGSGFRFDFEIKVKSSTMPFTGYRPSLVHCKVFWYAFLGLPDNNELHSRWQI